MQERDKSIYRHKGIKETTVKTVYGEVSYKRAVYEKTNADGSKCFVYLLDETLELKNVGLISTNLAEKVVEEITELSYRQCTAKVSEMTGQHISPMGVWKVIQELGEQVSEEETVGEIWENILLSVKATKKDGKGYCYPVMGHLVGLGMGTRGDRVKLNTMAGY